MLEKVNKAEENNRGRMHGHYPDVYPRLDHDSDLNMGEKLKDLKLKNPELYEEVTQWANGSVVTTDGKHFPDSVLAVLWHGTNNKFDSFDYEDMEKSIGMEISIGFHFGTRYAAKNRVGEGAILIPIITSVSNPLRLHDAISFIAHNNEFIDAIVESVAANYENEEDGWDTEGEDEALEFGLGELSKKGLLKKRLKEASTEGIRQILQEDYGYDSIVYENTQEELNYDGYDSIIIFDPRDIRNAKTFKPMWKE